MTKALIIVDVQNDFVTGSLATDPQEEAVARMSNFVEQQGSAYDLIVTTQDWHIDPGDHFSDTPDFKNSWPVHCVANEKGAELHPLMNKALYKLPFIQVFKGQYIDAYSGFEGADNKGTLLQEILESHNIEKVDIMGIATDFCVKETALDAVKNGFSATVLSDYVQGVDPEVSRELLTQGFTQANVSVK